MKLGTFLVAGALRAGALIAFNLWQRNRDPVSLRADKPAKKVKKKDKGILEGKPIVRDLLFALPTVIGGWAPAPQYRIEDTERIYRENAAGLNKWADLTTPFNPNEAASYSW
jgi:hypothetical protein